MAENLVENRILSNTDLESLESALKKEISEIDKQMQRLTYEVTQRMGTLSRIKKLRRTSGNGSKSISDQLANDICDILRKAGEPVAKNKIRKEYEGIKGESLDDETLIACLYKHRGKLWDVVGERGGAKWGLLEES